MNKEAYTNYIVLHLYYVDLWQEFWTMLEPLLDENNQLIITLPEEHAGKVREYESSSPYISCKVFLNLGADIRPFLIVMQELLSSGKKINAVTKIHSKKSLTSHASSEFGNMWRKSLYTDLLVHNRYLTDTLQKDSEIGLIAKKDWYVYESPASSNYKVEEKAILSAANLFNIDKLNLPYRYVTGTMFIASFEYLKELIVDSNIDEVLEKMQESHKQNGTLAHGIERILSYGLLKYNKKIALI